MLTPMVAAPNPRDVEISVGSAAMNSPKKKAAEQIQKKIRFRIRFKKDESFRVLPSAAA